MQGRQPPPPPPRDPNKSHGPAEGMRVDHPLFEAFYVVSVEERIRADDAECLSKGGGENDGDDAGEPRSSAEAYQRASRQCPPRVVWRFPSSSSSSGETVVREEDVLRFCFPDKQTLRPSRPEKFVASEFVFVVTDSSGAKAYGFCRRMLPCGPGGRYDVGRCRLPECLCVVSRRPFFGIFHSVLAVGQALRLLHQASFSDDNRGNGYKKKKLEELLEALLAGGLGATGGNRVPGPGQELVASGLRFVRPVDENMSLNDVPVAPLLVKLGPRNFLRLWSAILCERRIVLVAEDVKTLSSCVHAAMAMLYPFAWQHVFIPLLPWDMLAYTSAPMPFVIGVRTSQLEAVKQQPMSEAVFVLLDLGELTVSTGMDPVPDICDGVKEHLASAHQKLDRALGKLALLTRSIKDKDSAIKDKGRGPYREELSRGMSSKGMMTKDGINDTASDLFAEVKAIFGRAKKPRPGGEVGAGMVTAEDHALREAMIGFHIGLFGDHRTILRKQPDAAVKVDREYFIRYRRDQRGDSEGVLRFLQEFTESQMFHMHMMHVKDRLLNKQGLSSLGSSRGGLGLGPEQQHHSFPATFLRVSDELMGMSTRVSGPTMATDVNGGFSPAAVKRTLSKVLSETLPAGSGSNVYGDPTLNPRALEATSNTTAGKDLAKLRAELCRTARETAKLSGIMRVVWVRLQDCKGHKWPHAMEGLRLLKALMLSGPEGCIADALSNVPVVRRLTQYPKGWEEVLVGAAEVGKVAPGIRAMAREVVTLMMDLKRLSLRREAVANIKLRADERAATTEGGPEKIKLRSRCMPDFSTLHSLVGEASFGDSSNQTGTYDVTALFSRGTSSGGGGSEHGSQGSGGLQGFQGFGDDVDGSGRRVWQDMAAICSLPAAGGGDDEDSSDGESTGGRVMPPLPSRDSTSSRDSSYSHAYSNSNIIHSPQAAVLDSLTDPAMDFGSNGCTQVPFQGAQQVDEYGFPIEQASGSSMPVTGYSSLAPTLAHPPQDQQQQQQQQQQQHVPSPWAVPDQVYYPSSHPPGNNNNNAHFAGSAPSPPRPPPVVTSPPVLGPATSKAPPPPPPRASSASASAAYSASFTTATTASPSSGFSAAPSVSQSSSLRPSQLFAPAAASNLASSSASGSVRPSQLFAGRSVKPEGGSAGGGKPVNGAGVGVGMRSSSTGVAGLVGQFEKLSPTPSAPATALRASSASTRVTQEVHHRQAYGQHMLRPVARQQDSAMPVTDGAVAPEQQPQQQAALTWQQQGMQRHTQQHLSHQQLALRQGQATQQRAHEEQQMWRQQQHQQQQYPQSQPPPPPPPPPPRPPLQLYSQPPPPLQLQEVQQQQQPQQYQPVRYPHYVTNNTQSGYAAAPQGGQPLGLGFPSQWNQPQEQFQQYQQQQQQQQMAGGNPEDQNNGQGVHPGAWNGNEIMNSSGFGSGNEQDPFAGL